MRPEWLRGMRRGEGEDVVRGVVGLVLGRVFCCRCLFPEGWVDWQGGEVVDVFRYLRGLVEARGVVERGL